METAQPVLLNAGLSCSWNKDVLPSIQLGPLLLYLSCYLWLLPLFHWKAWLFIENLPTSELVLHGKGNFLSPHLPCLSFMKRLCLSIAALQLLQLSHCDCLWSSGSSFSFISSQSQKGLNLLVFYSPTSLFLVIKSKCRFLLSFVLGYI